MSWKEKATVKSDWKSDFISKNHFYTICKIPLPKLKILLNWPSSSAAATTGVGVLPPPRQQQQQQLVRILARQISIFAAATKLRHHRQVVIGDQVDLKFYLNFLLNYCFCYCCFCCWWWCYFCLICYCCCCC